MAKKNKYYNRAVSAEDKTKSKSGRSDNLIFIICILIAALFWGLIKLSHIYPASYTLKVSYENVPVEKRLTRITDTTVVVNFSARGFAIMKFSFFDNMTDLKINLAEHDLMRKDDDAYFIYTQELRDDIALEIGLPEPDIDFSKTTLGFILEDLHEKLVKVRSNVKLNFKEQFDLYEKEIVTPMTIKVFGPKDMLDTISEVLTQNIQFDDVNSDKDIMVHIDNPSPKMLHFDPDFVSIKIRVEKFTESSVDIPIDFSGIKENIKSFPASAKINFKVAQKDFNNIQPDQFRVMPEMRGININDVDQLHLTLVEKPGFIRNEWIVPADVEFLIIK